MRRLILEADKRAADRYATRMDNNKINGHDRLSAYWAGFIAGVSHARRKQRNDEERQRTDAC